MSGSPTSDRRQRGRSRLRRCALVAVLVLFAVELVLGWPSLASAVSHLRAPDPAWLAAAVMAELAAMGTYARMQRRLLRAAGLRVPLRRNLALAYAAHSLNETLPGGPAFSTHFNYQQMRRFGATPAIAAWCIALSGILSATALAGVTAVGVLASHGSPSWFSLVALSSLVVLLVLGIRSVNRHPVAVHSAIHSALACLNRLCRRPADRGFASIRGFIEQLGAARLTAGHGAVAATFAVLNWVLDAAALWFCLLAVSDDPVRPAQLLLAFCAGMAAGTFTIVPGGLGIIDSALILGLVAGGAGMPTAIATVVLYRIISFGFIIGIGWITWLALRRGARTVSGAQHAKTARSRQPAVRCFSRAGA